MRVEVLTVPDCPHGPLVTALLREALEEEGIQAVVHHTVIRDRETAKIMQFCSSPTIRINGYDIWTQDAPTGPQGISCRIFPGNRETNASLAKAIRQALRRRVRSEGT
jgi:glutaredoxin